jgi:hypothetical protein
MLGVIIGARPIRRELAANRWVGRSRGETGGNLGEARKADLRGAVRAAEKRQSGVVDIDGGLRQGVH